jgi:hypothetical protein
MVSPDLPIDDHVITKKIKALKAQQPIGDIFVATVDFALIQQMTFFDVRRRIQKDRDVEKYLGIQRPLNDKRVRDLNEYVNFIDATFPTSIILAVESDYVTYNEKSQELSFSNTKTGSKKPDVAFRNLFRVIDGQHRIAGLEGFKGKKFDVLVSIFVGSDLADQAHVFATVNLEQTKVGRGEKLKLVGGDEDRRYCFRNMFIREKDVQIGKIVEQYFLAVQKRWPEAWDQGGKGLMLNQSNGFRALMRVLGPSYNHIALPGQFADSSKFYELFKRVDVKSNHFTSDRFPPGTSGESRLREFLMSEVFGE